MKTEPMKTPLTREEFEHRFHLLKEKMNQGQMHFAPGVGQGLDKVRCLPNGRMDFLSVNESARLQANSMFTFGQGQIQEMLDEIEASD
tara:strand:- start:8937 stop:9200 length:264 start_codon:yes stop_codon:yes gene_type:complete